MRRYQNAEVRRPEVLTFKCKLVRQISQELRSDLLTLAKSLEEIDDCFEQGSTGLNYEDVRDSVVRPIKYLDHLACQLLGLMRIEDLYDRQLQSNDSKLGEVKGLRDADSGYVFANGGAVGELFARDWQQRQGIHIQSDSDRKNSQRVAKDTQFIDKLHNYIENNIDKKITVEDVAESFCMDRSSFTRKVKSITFLNTQNYILHYRLNKAYEYLPDAQSVCWVADKLGFNTQNHLSTSFSKHFGITCRERMSGKESQNKPLMYK